MTSPQGDAAQNIKSLRWDKKARLDERYLVTLYIVKNHEGNPGYRKVKITRESRACGLY